MRPNGLPARQLVAHLIDMGVLGSPRWQRAFRTVSRSPFLHQVYLPAGDQLMAMQPDDPVVLQLAQSDVALVTQVNGDSEIWARSLATGPVRGTPTSASTRPSLTATMLEALDVHAGHRVLEIGTGTGYTTALLCAGLGDANVTTVEIDPELASRASGRLCAMGFEPVLAGIDGTAGYPAAAPYDRILATCALPAVPAAWLSQCRPGALIMLSLYRDLDPGALLLLTVHEEGIAHGQFLPYAGRLLPSRTIPQPPGHDWQAAEPSPEDRRRTNVPGAALGDADFLLFAALRMAGVRTYWPPARTAYGAPTWLTDRRGSWAVQRTFHGGHEVEQAGERRLWDEFESAHDLWIRAGRPSRSRLGLSITRNGLTAWVDRPSSRLSWVLPMDWDRPPPPTC